MWPAEERGRLGRDLPCLRVGRLAPTDDEVDVPLFLDRQRERSSRPQRVGDREDAVGEVRRAASACGGPIVIAITSASSWAAACATAAASNGLRRTGTPSRRSCFVSWSNSIESGRGTCLTRQMIFTHGSLGQ
jgi:hypothetical protein